MAAWALTGAPLIPGPLLIVLTAFLWSTRVGMFLNDAFDSQFDAQHHPERPIPSNLVTRREALVIGFGLLGIAWVLLLLSAALNSEPSFLKTGVIASALVGCVVLYDRRHKGVFWGPWLMGACRMLAYWSAAIAGVGLLPPRALWAPGVLFVYVVGLSYVARSVQRPGLVIALIAGISGIDAYWIVSAGHPGAAGVALGCGILTVVLQRFVRGT